MTPLSPGSLAADFPDGTEFLSTSAQIVDQSSAYLVTATQNISGLATDEINLSIPENASVPYTVQGTDGAYVIYEDATTGTEYEANASQGNCSITVTQISPTFEGTFNARMICNTTSDSVRILSNGVFNASYY
jgi:Family of unknown function (DUF6252)